jgi:1-aminocyclopropane-1-carboxylate deaminase
MPEVIFSDHIITPLEYCDTLHEVEVYIKRDDLTHPEIMGNKWRKLKYNFLEYEKGNFEAIISFGGAFSNHVFSLASLSKYKNIPLHLIIRGEDADEGNPTLAHAIKCGAFIHKVSRDEYRLKEHGPVAIKIIQNLKNIFIIPEGGTNSFAYMGVREVINDIRNQIDRFDYFVSSFGTGGTAAGLISAIHNTEQLVVYPALKGSWIKNEITNLTGRSYTNLTIRYQYTFGGYAKNLDMTQEIIIKYSKKYGFQLDPVYTSKAFEGMMIDIENGFYAKGSRIVFYHSGGLQGQKGYEWMGRKA